MTKVPPKRAFKNVALFTDDENGTLQEPTTLPLSKIRLPKTQPRRYFDSEAMQSLIASIQKDGLLQPILVRPVGDMYEVVAGERRYRATSSLKLSDIPVVIKEFSDQEAYLIALTENLQREDLNPIEETEGILSLLSIKLEQSEKDIIHLLQRLDHLERGNLKEDSDSAHNVMGRKIIEEVFEGLGLTWQSFLKNRLPLLKLPEDILEPLRQGKIEYTKAKAIAKIKEESARKKIMTAAIAESLSLREIKERIKEAQPQPPQKEEVFTRLDDVSKQVKKSKKFLLENPRKRKKIESLLAQIEKVLEVEK